VHHVSLAGTSTYRVIVVSISPEEKILQHHLYMPFLPVSIVVKGISVEMRGFLYGIFRISRLRTRFIVMEQSQCAAKYPSFIHRSCFLPHFLAYMCHRRVLFLS